MPKNKIKIACAQINSTQIISENLTKIEKYSKKAKENGCNLITFPEYSTYIPGINAQINFSNSDFIKSTEEIKNIAKSNGIDIIFGTLREKIDNKKNIAKHLNQALYINRNGDLAFEYSKIHLFDANVGGIEYRESLQFFAGNESKVFNINSNIYGICICYDLRFPQLFRILAKNGAKVIFVPSAFTKKSGAIHWEQLLRARAIENSVYIIAPAQVGKHLNNRETYGHSMIVSPDGIILKSAKRSEKLISHDLDLNIIDEKRNSIGSMHNDQKFSTPSGKVYNDLQ
jgi:predicted amidohydrolase